MNKDRNDISFLYREEPDLDLAWADMRQKLDQKLPVKKQHSKFFFTHSHGSTVIFLILMICSLPTNKNGDFDHWKNSSAEYIKEKPRTLFRLLIGKKNGLYAGSNKDNSKTKTWRLISRERNTDYLAIINPIGPEKISPLYKRNISLKDISLINSSPAKKNKKKANKVIGFDIGVYYNIGSSLSDIYPIANITFPLTKKGSISLGIGMSSVVPVKNFSPRELIILNDTVNQVQFGVKQNVIKKATYIDIPISLHYRISERFEVNAGMQVSFLQDFKKEEEYKTYNFQADISKILSPNIGMASSLTTFRTYSEPYTVRKANWRFIIGMSYRHKDVGFKFLYQRSLTPNYYLFDFGGIHSREKLSIFTVGMYYHIR